MSERIRELSFEEKQKQTSQGPRVTFPTEPKRIENGSIKPDGKHKSPKPRPQGQSTLWPRP